MEPHLLNRVYIATLGCPKNEVDSQVLARCLNETEWQVVNSIDEADVAIINTCGFIEPAKAESIEFIWKLLEIKEKGHISAVVVTGCLAERYSSLLAEEIPELDAIFGNRNVCEIPNLLHEVLNKDESSTDKPPFIAFPKDFQTNWYANPTKSSNSVWGYLKIAEGCDNCCNYCAVPGIRGGLRSVPIESLIKQAKYLIDSGAKEIVLIAQDTMAYGHDKGQKLLPELLRRISDIEGEFWLRVLYAHPRHIDTDDIIALTETPKVVPYLDIPIQHIAEPVLERMGRKVSGKEIREKISLIRELRPDIALRTSLIVGFPGESDEDFEELAEYLDDGDFIHGGVFSYSREDGTKAAGMDNEVAPRDVESRKLLIELIFNRLRAESNRGMEDQTVPVLVESGGTRANLRWGRTQYDAPEIDRMVRFYGNATVGTFVDVRIIRGTNYHLVGVQE